jgi:chitinase
VQHYNTGPVRALDNRNYSVPSADFHVAMSEMLLVGFPVRGINFPALRQDQVMFGVPASGFRGVMSWSINWDQSVSFSFSNDIGGYLDRN